MNFLFFFVRLNSNQAEVLWVVREVCESVSVCSHACVCVEGGVGGACVFDIKQGLC